MKFSLLDFNTLGTPVFARDITKRYKKITEIIDESQIDVVCLQEVSTYYHLSLLKKYIRTYPFLYKQNYVYGPRGGLVILSKMPLEDITYINFASLGSLKNLSFYTHLIKNGILSAKIEGHPVQILNTHLVTDWEFEWSPQNLYYNTVQTQVREVIKHVMHLTKKGQSVLLMGDFNMKKHSLLYDELIEKTKMKDIFEKETSPTYFIERLDYKFKGKTSERIDFIFVKEEKAKVKATPRGHMMDKQERLINGKLSYLSDHIGLRADIEIV
jgi:endonuclease/exonuclease/phosphatase family metal-dependent hydrolase